MYQYKSPQINIKVKKNCFLLKYVNSSKYEIRFCKFQYFFLKLEWKFSLQASYWLETFQ